MADTKLSSLDALAAADTDDLLYIADVSAGASGSKKITKANFLGVDLTLSKGQITLQAGNGTSGDSVLCGSEANAITAASPMNVIAGGGSASYPNQIIGGANICIISGGYDNTISGDATVQANTIGGGAHHEITDAGHCTIVGGSTNKIVVTTGTASYAGIFSGRNHDMGDDSDFSVIAGGDNNDLTGKNSVMLGGLNNTITDSDSAMISHAIGCSIGTGCDYCTILGGNTNAIASSIYGSVLGGFNNDLSGDYAVIVGGANQTITASNYGIICGGNTNAITGANSSIVGGNNNTASGTRSAVINGNSCTASGLSDLVLGSSSSEASGGASTVLHGTNSFATGSYSMVIGRAGTASANGSMIITDVDATPVTNNVANSLVMSFVGGIQIQNKAADEIGFFGATPVNQPNFIADPAAGATVDTEARTAINAILDLLIELGLMAAS